MARSLFIIGSITVISLTCLVDENAISFAQAEKLYYETSLINIGTEAQDNQSEAGKKPF